MYERSWEGEVEIRVPGKDSLRVVGRLWRHDDAGGTDWGGQLEIDVATATRLGTGEYAIVLPDGRESTVRLSRGASRARSAYPTFAGRGAPPFGSDLPKDVLATASSGDEATDEATDVEVEAAEAEPPTTEEAIETTRPARRRSRAATSEPVAEVALPDDEAEQEPEAPPEAIAPGDTPTAEALHENASVDAPARVAEAEVEDPADPEPEPAPVEVPSRTTPSQVHTPEIRKMADSPRTTVRPGTEGVSATEVMARAYLQAVETRRNLDGSTTEGFEALVLGGVAGIVDELAGLFEQRLRGERPDRQRGGDWLQQRFIVLDWFRAVVDGYEPMAATSSDLQSLVDTAIALFDGDAAQAAA